MAATAASEHRRRWRHAASLGAAGRGGVGGGEGTRGGRSAAAIRPSMVIDPSQQRRESFSRRVLGARLSILVWQLGTFPIRRHSSCFTGGNSRRKGRKGRPTFRTCGFVWLPGQALDEQPEREWEREREREEKRRGYAEKREPGHDCVTACCFYWHRGRAGRPHLVTFRDTSSPSLWQVGRGWPRLSRFFSRLAVSVVSIDRRVNQVGQSSSDAVTRLIISGLATFVFAWRALFHRLTWGFGLCAPWLNKSSASGRPSRWPIPGVLRRRAALGRRIVSAAF